MMLSVAKIIYQWLVG